MMLSIAPGCELEVQRGPEWLLVRVTNVDELQSECLPLVEQLWAVLEQHFTYRLVLELDQVRVLNSYLIGQLLQLHKRIEQRGGVMRLCGLSAYNRRVLQTCRLEDRFLPYHDRQEAVMGSRPPRQPK
jgi:anti-anti-sigma factor